MAKYFAGIRLPPKLEDECEAWRRQFKAPKTVAHITVVPPFEWNAHLDSLLQFIQTNLGPKGVLTIRGQGLGSFGTRVLFVNVDLSAGLRTLQARLVKNLTQAGVKVDARTYHPHITLATRLNQEQFDLYQKRATDFTPDYAFTCREISLFELTNLKGWQECARIPLGAPLSIKD